MFCRKMAKFVGTKSTTMTNVSELVALLSQVERGYTKLLNRRFLKAGFNLSREQYELLQVLWQRDNVNQQFIAKALHKDKYNVTKLLNVLQKRGYVQRKAGKEDKRSNLVVLTDLGREAERELTGIVEQAHTDITFTLSGEEIKALIWSLRKINTEE